MSRAEAARRLGANLRTCTACNLVVRRDAAFFFSVGVATFTACSIRHVESLAEQHPHKLGRAHRWSVFYERLAEIGTRGEGGVWRWTDTGLSLWIAENAERLRAAGEVT